MKKIDYQQIKNAIKTIVSDFTTNKKYAIIPIIIVFCIPVLLYLQTLTFGFVCFDDDSIIINNTEFLSHFGNSLQAFQTDAYIIKTSDFYRPLQTLSYMIDIQLSGGNNPWMYHFSNILLLGLFACLLYLLLRRFMVPTKLALLSTLIYCSHPLFVSSVAWIPARGDLLLSVFSLLSFLFFIKYLQKKEIKYLFLHWTAFTIALFCKETAVFLPLLFIIYYFTFSSDKRFEKKYLFNIVLYVISGIFWYWLRSKAIGDFSNLKDAFGQNEMFGLKAILSNLQTIPESLAKFFVPFGIAPIPSFSLGKTLIGLVIIVIIIIIFFINKERSKKEKIFCFSWFLLILLPTMLIKPKFIDYLDHRFFFPMAGMLLFVLFILPEKWFEKGDIKRSWLMVALFVFLSYFSFINSRTYSNVMTFYDSAISKNSTCAIAYKNRGVAYHIQGSLNEAINDYTKAVELKPDYANAYNCRGTAYFSQRLYDNAIADYTKVIELKLGDAFTYYNRGAAYCHQGLFDKACPDFKKAEELGSKAAKINITKFCNQR